ncbi:putative F-box/kelch-repeat protein At1g15680 [Sesamum indicum]|uniref:F-box/kelch-repeat protein At1g15680 n=1 Tax=Sesamum indicum TaxID=4182 RepID=A0A6I9UDQ3_SESIN|nr:putative F-box/kelch-repeat protein At1g15680 [Sesamum indicum]
MKIDGDEVGLGGGEGDGVEVVDTKSVSRVKLDLNIPEWLLVEVLVRLPVKQVFSLKLVCKQWRSVISDPFFIRMYVLRASMSRELPPWTYISYTLHVDGYYIRHSEHPSYELLLDVYSRDFKCPSFYVLPCPHGHYGYTSRYTVLGVSNGLVLYGPLVCCLNYGICNPITRQWMALPPHSCLFNTVRGGLVTKVDNGVLTSYRAVRIEIILKGSSRIRFEVFFSEIGEWKSFTVVTEQVIRINSRRMATILDGILHWVTGKHGIIAYDPYEKPDSLRFIALPGDIDRRCNNAKHHGIPSLCDAHQGRLRYFEMSGFCKRPYGFSSIGIWILNDYSSGEWCLQHRVRAADILYDDVLSGQYLFLQPMSFHPFDSDILYLGYENIIVSYNINSRKLKAHGGELGIELTIGGEQPCWLLAFLFVIPPWPLYLPPLPHPFIPPPPPGAVEALL